MRALRTTAMDLRVGDLLVLDESQPLELWRVNSNLVSRQAQGRPFAQLELRHSRSGTKKDVRMRSDDACEKAELESPTRLQVLYSDSTTVTLMHPTTFEQSELPLASLGEGAPFVHDGMTLTVEFYKGTVASLTMPAKVELEVVDVESAREAADTRSNTALLANKLKLKVPRHVKVGDRILVTTADGLFAGKP